MMQGIHPSGIIQNLRMLQLQVTFNNESPFAHHPAQQDDSNSLDATHGSRFEIPHLAFDGMPNNLFGESGLHTGHDFDFSSHNWALETPELHSNVLHPSTRQELEKVSQFLKQQRLIQLWGPLLESIVSCSLLCVQGRRGIRALPW